MQQISSSEYVEWLVYLDLLEFEKHTKDDYYNAQIACEIRRSYVQKPNKVQIDNFLLEFKDSNKFINKTKIKKEEKLSMSKAFWGALVGTKVK